MKVFNRGVVVGKGFCNRVQETQQLLNNIENITHSLLISPRRYGKTSLALHALAKSKLPYAHIDLFMKYDKTVIFDEFYQSIGQLVGRVIKPGEKALKMIESLFKHLKVTLMLGKSGLEFTLMPLATKKKESIKLLLLGLDELLARNNKRAVVFVDEIQTITESEVSDEIESSLRFVAQKTQNISFIFSGSSRHLLSKIFDDRSRPFYKLCQRMELHRISKIHYEAFINRLAKKKWKVSLSDDALQTILEHTQCHPYYVSVLCEKLFLNAQVPDIITVETNWHNVCVEEQSSVAKDIEFLTPKQKRLLSEIAKVPDLKEPTGKNFVNKVSFTPRGISQAIKILLKHDLIEKLPNGCYRVIDPVLAYWLI